VTKQGWRAVQISESCGWSLTGVWRRVLVLRGVVPV
jgi:hypothetical protein